MRSLRTLCLVALATSSATAQDIFRLRGNGDDWFLGADARSCDGIMRLGVAMQFGNCIGDEGATLANTSHSRVE